jgi:hypothetical protein
VRTRTHAAGAPDRIPGQQVLEDAALLDALLDALQILAHALTSERIFACTCADWKLPPAVRGGGVGGCDAASISTP